MPVLEGLAAFKAADNETAHQRALELLTAHGEKIINTGTAYPTLKVNCEQSIVAPASRFLLEMARFTGNTTWLEVAQAYFYLLLLFGGQQPDYHLYDVAIRHWYGYWFGKDRMWGDTFPHYWSALSAISMHHYANLTGDGSYESRAQSVHRSDLALFDAGGTASSAWLYPPTVGGRAAHYKDPYVNDKDCALNHCLLSKACFKSPDSASQVM